MKHYKLDDMTRGWFVGDFNPTTFSTKNAEVCVKHYRAGEKESKHHHRISTEITVIVSGKVRMNGREYGAGDIIVMEPFEATDFEAITDAVNTVVKVPSSKNDKYDGEYSKN